METIALQLIQQKPRHNYNRMAIAILLSLTVHGLLLLIHFQPIALYSKTTSVTVTLVNSTSPHTPLKPQALAQAQLDGGGNQQAGLAATPLPHTADTNTPTNVLQELHKRQAELEQQQLKLLSQLESEQKIKPENPQANLSGQSQIQGQDNIDQQSQIINAQIAAIKKQIQNYNANPKKTFIAPSTESVDYAEYVESWRQQIEAIGTRHYPPEARGKIYGDLQLTVYIKKDGQLDHIEFDRPAKQAILNSAAKRIIELAQPFKPLPNEIAQNTDILVITRTWHFTRDGLETEN